MSPEAAAVPRFEVGVVASARHRHDGRRHGVHGGGRRRVPAVPVAATGELWRALGDAGVVPAGLGARDTLRLEAGLPLHGHELGPGITPLQAGLGWVVAWAKPRFRGRDALAAEKERGVTRRLRGLRVDGRRPPPRRTDDPRRGRTCGGRDQRQLLAGPAVRHRTRVRAALGRDRRRGGDRCPRRPHPGRSREDPVRVPLARATGLTLGLVLAHRLHLRGERRRDERVAGTHHRVVRRLRRRSCPWKWGMTYCAKSS